MLQPATPMSVIDAIYKRHAVRSYTARKIDHATIHALLDAAVHAPTALHEEPWAFAVIQDREMLKRLSDSAKENIGDLLKNNIAVERLAHPIFNIFYDAGTLIVIYAKPMGPFVAADCWLAAENLMLAARAMELGTCVIGLAVGALNTPEWKAALGIPPEMAAIAPIIVGVPASEPPSVNRKQPEILLWKEATQKGYA